MHSRHAFGRPFGDAVRLIAGGLPDLLGIAGALAHFRTRALFGTEHRMIAASTARVDGACVSAGM